MLITGIHLMTNSSYIIMCADGSSTCMVLCRLALEEQLTYADTQPDALVIFALFLQGKKYYTIIISFPDYYYIISICVVCQ